LWKLFKLGKAFRRLGQRMGEAIEILTGRHGTILDRWFESEQLKSTWPPSQSSGPWPQPTMPGTAYVLFHHVMGETTAKRGVWGYVQGRHGGAKPGRWRPRAATLKVDIRCDAEVSRILVSNGSVTGVALANGQEFQAPIVARTSMPNLTFNRLLETKLLPPEFSEAINRIGYESASLKINVALSELRTPGLSRHHAGIAPSRTIHNLPRSGLHRTRLRRTPSTAGRRSSDAALAEWYVAAS